MPYADREGWLSISFSKWMDTCVAEDTYAFTIEIETEEQLKKVEEVFRRLYPDVSRIKQLLLERDGCITGYIIKCSSNRYILREKDIRIILKREIRDETFSVKRVQDCIPDGKATVLAHPTGCPWRIHSSF